MNVFAQILAIFGLLFLIISVQLNNKLKILFCKIISNIFYGLQYLFLSAFSGACMSLLSLIRNIVFYLYNKNKSKIPISALIIFLIIMFVVSFWTFDTLLSLIPIFATMIHTYAVWQDNLKVYRFLSLIGAISWIVYNMLMGAYISAGASCIEFINAAIAIYRHDIKKKKILK